jgi:hypothetical protein
MKGGPKILEIREDACGFKPGPAANLVRSSKAGKPEANKNQNPFFEMNDRKKKIHF